ncbi:hypothetical protein ACIBHX_28895 [Nonomuraea sp. NPDC050536]|uniref:hypothetical protein n=1 Tax=Nonomuraea sp. NPDC050536 TaxID=3364366 RepID=UPI0037CB564C
MTLLLAALVMLAFVAIPRRLWYLQIPAILGWALVWVDNNSPGSGGTGSASASSPEASWHSGGMRAATPERECGTFDRSQPLAAGARRRSRPAA